MRLTTAALARLQQSVDAPVRQNTGSWRWTVRQSLAGVRDLLVSESAAHDNAWLAARTSHVLAERNALLIRLGKMGPRVLEEESLEDVREELRRLIREVDRHLQRMQDLAWDDVGMELGGSE